MKKMLIRIGTVLIGLLLTGCSLSSNPTTTTTTTTDPRELLVDAELDRVNQLFPEAIHADFSLPVSADENILLTFEIEGGLIESGMIRYQPTHSDDVITLTVSVTIDTITKTQVVYLISLRSQDLFNQHLIDQAFLDIESLLYDIFPDTIESDFTMPDFEYPDTTIRYTVSTSRIYNDRFVFPFPTVGEFLTVSVRVNYKNIIRTIPVTVFMKGYNDLSQIPIVNITTRNGETVEWKDEYIQATLSLVTFDENNRSVEVYTNIPIEIRARGNSTLFMPKKSYRIKFQADAPFLSSYSERDWVLLANFADQTLIRNYLAYNFARNLNMEFAPAAEFVDVHMNGSYNGNYMLTDQIEVTVNRVNIEEKSSALDTGYLIELDARQGNSSEDIEGFTYFSLYGRKYAIKSPDTDKAYYSVNQLYYIESYFVDIHNALVNKRSYDHLIDEASFIDWYIVNELFKNVDSGFYSIYFFKPKGEKLKMGPVWDFDLSTSNQGHLNENERQPTGWYTSLPYKNYWFYHLMQYPKFQSALKARWNEIYDVQIQAMMDDIYPASDRIAKSRYDNFNRWEIIGKNNEWYTSTEVLAAKTYEEQMEILYDYLMIRKDWMNTEINKFN
jgi:hypothetical protein